jgi:hypothetical protein
MADGLLKSAVRLAQRARRGEAGCADSMASPRVPLVLALEVQAGRKTLRAEESPGVDSEDGGSKSHLGREAHCQRAEVKAGNPGFTLSMANSKFMRQTESGTCLDNGSATGRNQNSVETRMIPSDPAIARSIRSASGEHYSNVESRAVSSPDRSCSRTASDPGIRAGWSQSVSPQTDVKAGRREAF